MQSESEPAPGQTVPDTVWPSEPRPDRTFFLRILVKKAENQKLMTETTRISQYILNAESGVGTSQHVHSLASESNLQL